MADKTLLRFGIVMCLIYAESSQGLSHQGFAVTKVASLQWLGLRDPCTSNINNSSVKAQDGNNLRLQIHHMYSSCFPVKKSNLSWNMAALEMLQSDIARENAYTNASGELDSWVASGETIGTGNYIVRVGFGTPSSGMYVLIDTGSDITWIQCDPCPQCYKQQDALFQPMGSTSYRPLLCNSTECQQLQSFTKVCMNNSCSYRVSYGDNSTTKGDFALETLTLTSSDSSMVSVQNFAFGCGHANKGLFSGAAGLLGLGRNSIGFPSQTSSYFGQVFSYCLPSVSSSVPSGFLHFGEAAIMDYDVQFTPLVSSRSNPSQYFVNLIAISIGDDLLSVSATIMVDSGTVISRLERSLYARLKDAFNQNMPRLQTALPVAPFDTCFRVSSVYEISMPLITVHFQNSVDLHLTPVHILYPADDGIMCFAFAASTNGRNVLGNFQQQTYRIVYDIPNARLGISALECN